MLVAFRRAIEPFVKQVVTIVEITQATMESPQHSLPLKWLRKWLESFDYQVS